jgi:hypothetical protein
MCCYFSSLFKRFPGIQPGKPPVVSNPLPPPSLCRKHTQLRQKGHTMRRVVITGMGIVSSIGNNAGEAIYLVTDMKVALSEA